MVNYYFWGNFFPPVSESEILKKSKGHVQNAANALQWKMIYGLEQNLTDPMSLVTGCSIGSFPKNYKDLFFRSTTFSHREGVKDKQIGFINLTVLKQIVYHSSYKRYIRQTIEFNDDDVVIAYSAGLLKELIYAKKKNPNIKTCLVLPDLPHLTSLDSNNRLLQCFKRYQTRKLMSAFINKRVDSAVVLTKQMAEFLCLAADRYVVVDGICDSFPTIEKNCGKTEKHTTTILYTGTLAIKYGILNLIDEFKKLGGDYSLIVCGGGDESNQVRSRCMDDSRIDFRGLIPHQEALKLQKEVDILVNPRKNDYEFTKYSFPSKLLEYLSTGKPVICYKLDGINSEYDNIFFYADDKEGGLANKIEEVANMDEANYLDYLNRLSVFLNKKTAQAQCSKIISLLNTW